MAKQTINVNTPNPLIGVGQSANDRSGDTLRLAFTKINDAIDKIDANFNELYSTEAAAADRLVNGTHVVSLETDGVLTMPDGLTIDNSAIGYTTSDTITEETVGGTVSQTTSYQNQIIVDTTDAIRIAKIITQTVNDGVVTTTDSTGSTIDVDGTGVSIKKYVEPDGPNNGSYFQISTTNSGAIIEGVNEELLGNTYGRVTVTQGVVAINVAAEGLDKQWSFNSGGEFIVPEAGTIMGTNDLTIESQTAGNSSGLFLNGNPILGTAILYAHRNAIIRSDNNGDAKDWNFDKSGTITTPSLLPKVFDAVVDSVHYAGEGSLTLEGDAWYFAVEFRVNASGTVETIITNNTPWPSNPGYANNMPFVFTEEDHGIPNYTFTLTLTDIQNPGMFMYTTNLAASIPPPLPATINSPETIKLTADAVNWTFSPDGNLTLPGRIIFPNGAASIYGNTGLVGLFPSPTSNSGLEIAEGGSADLFNAGNIVLTTNWQQEGGSKVWTFNTNGSLENNSSLTRTVNGANIDVALASPTVIWTALDTWTASAKLTIQIEGNAAGDNTGWHTQVCEAIISARAGRTNDPLMTVYGVIHTSVAPLATFTVQRNATTNLIELVATPTVTADLTLYPKVYSVEMISRD